MKPSEQQRALAVSVEAARAAGALMRRNLRATKRINDQTQHDIKLELDVRCQKLIERKLTTAFPRSSVLGEEGVLGDPSAAVRWIVDPIDGTVNFTYGIPHACVSIALQTLRSGDGITGSQDSDFETVLGAVYDPFREELWTAIRGQKARLNGRPVRASRRKRLEESVIAIGFGKRTAVLESMLPTFTGLVHRVRKLRVLGSAALELSYVATGRLDAFIEGGVRLWDIAAGGLILECAGGEFWHQQLPGEHVYAVNGNNGLLRRALEECACEPAPIEQDTKAR